MTMMTMTRMMNLIEHNIISILKCLQAVIEYFYVSRIYKRTVQPSTCSLLTSDLFFTVYKLIHYFVCEWNYYYYFRIPDFTSIISRTNAIHHCSLSGIVGGRCELALTSWFTISLIFLRFLPVIERRSCFAKLSILLFVVLFYSGLCNLYTLGRVDDVRSSGEWFYEIHGFWVARTTLAYEMCSRFSRVFERLGKTSPTKVHHIKVCWIYYLPRLL